MSGVVLAYHRVAELALDPQMLAVTPRNFDEHLQVIRSRFRPVSLRAASKLLAGGDSLDGIVVLTFDDGYADSLSQLAPLLERYEVSATVFLTSGYVGGGGEFWWDELEQILLGSPTLPRELGLTLRGGERRWDLGAAAVASEEERAAWADWTIVISDDPSPRHRVYRELECLLRRLRKEEQQRVLRALRSWAGTDGSARETHRILTCEEVAELAAHPLVEVGAHTISHPVLARLTPAEQWLEIDGSKTELERIAGTAVTSFSYPFGRRAWRHQLATFLRGPEQYRADYTRQTARIVRYSGFERAVANFGGQLARRSNAFELPRIDIHDGSGDTLARVIEQAGQSGRAAR